MIEILVTDFMLLIASDVYPRAKTYVPLTYNIDTISYVGCLCKKLYVNLISFGQFGFLIKIMDGVVPVYSVLGLTRPLGMEGYGSSYWAGCRHNPLILIILNILHIVTLILTYMVND